MSLSVCLLKDGLLSLSFPQEPAKKYNEFNIVNINKEPCVAVLSFFPFSFQWGRGGVYQMDTCIKIQCFAAFFKFSKLSIFVNSVVTMLKIRQISIPQNYLDL